MDYPKFNKERWDFGTQKEKELQPLLEYALQDTLTKTSELFDSIDFFCEEGDYWVELKSRRPYDKWGRPVYYNTYSTWFVPCTKRASDKPVYIFYWFEQDKTLWYIQYDEAKFKTFKRGIPPGHLTNQLHWLIPISEWEQLDVEEIKSSIQSSTSQ